MNPVEAVVKFMSASFFEQYCKLREIHYSDYLSVHFLSLTAEFVGETHSN